VEHIQRFKGGLPSFFERHHIDVFCMQEVKLSSKTIAAEGAKIGADVPGFESFWACNEGAGAQRQGLNGVATYARAGTVVRADCEPLGERELDKEGRCLLTDHGAFVLFNVYVPNSSGGSRLPFKLRFLRALRAAMQRERAKGKAVVLAGDLNMKARAVDSRWSSRLVEVPRIAESLDSCVSGEAREAAMSVAAAWPGIVAALRRKEHRTFETKRNGQSFMRWGVFAESTSGEVARLGHPMGSEEWAQASFQVDGAGVEQDGDVIFGPASVDATYVLQRPGEMSVGDLAECMKRLAGVELSQRALRDLATSFGGISLAPSLCQWFEAVQRQDGMADSFAEVHPQAEERFTCWDQSRNMRHENVGARIDYILVDRGFFAPDGASAHPVCGLKAYAGRPQDSPEAALAAAILGGLSQPAAYAGGGLPQLEEDEYAAQFRAEPGTGMLYTPPQMSDHIAVTALLRGVPVAAAAKQRDAASLRCQPHRSSKRITDFFVRKPSTAELPPAKRVAVGAA